MSVITEADDKKCKSFLGMKLMPDVHPINFIAFLFIQFVTYFSIDFFLSFVIFILKDPDYYAAY